MPAYFKIANAFTQATTGIFILEIFAAHIVYRNADIYATPLSAYAVGPYWWLVTSGLVFTAVNYLLLSRLFREAEPNANTPLALGSRLLFAAGLTALTVALFPTDIGPATTLKGTIHVAAAHLHFILLPVAAILAGYGLRSRPLLIYKKITFTFSGCLIAIGSAIVVDAEILATINFSGILQKILILIILTWIMYTSAVLSRKIRNEG